MKYIYIKGEKCKVKRIDLFDFMGGEPITEKAMCGYNNSEIEMYDIRKLDDTFVCYGTGMNNTIDNFCSNVIELSNTLENYA